jgi:hypothetical protein
VSVNLKTVLAFGALAGLTLGGLCGCGLCKVEILEETTSPDNKWTATVLTRDCGATTAEYMAVNVHEFAHKHLDSENDVFLTKHVRLLHVSWNGNDSLILDCENCIAREVEKKMDKHGAVQIVYR